MLCVALLIKNQSEMDVIFLDRDGVINEDYGYVHNWEYFKFINGSLKALELLTKHKFQIIYFIV